MQPNKIKIHNIIRSTIDRIIQSTIHSIIHSKYTAHYTKQNTIQYKEQHTSEYYTAPEHSTIPHTRPCCRSVNGREVSKVSPKIGTDMPDNL